MEQKLLDILAQARSEGYINVDDGSDDLLIDDVMSDASSDNRDYVDDQDQDLIKVYRINDSGYRESVASYILSR